MHDDKLIPVSIASIVDCVLLSDAATKCAPRRSSSKDAIFFRMSSFNLLAFIPSSLETSKATFNFKSINDQSLFFSFSVLVAKLT